MSETTNSGGQRIPPIVSEIAKRAMLRSLNMSRGSAELVQPSPGDRLGNLQLALRGGGTKHSLPRTIACGFGLDVEVQANGASTPVARFSCDFAGLFEINDEPFFAGLTDQDIATFAGFNFSHNAWPYAREYVQSMAGRLGLPPILLPLFRVADLIPAPENWQQIGKPLV